MHINPESASIIVFSTMQPRLLKSLQGIGNKCFAPYARLEQNYLIQELLRNDTQSRESLDWVLEVTDLVTQSLNIWTVTLYDYS